jgi:hypothetical protein
MMMEGEVLMLTLKTKEYQAMIQDKLKASIAETNANKQATLSLQLLS